MQIMFLKFNAYSSEYLVAFVMHASKLVERFYQSVTVQIHQVVI